MLEYIHNAISNFYSITGKYPNRIILGTKVHDKVISEAMEKSYVNEDKSKMSKITTMWDVPVLRTAENPNLIEVGYVESLTVDEL